MAHSILSRATECLSLFNECLTQEKLRLNVGTERHRAAFILWASTIGAFADRSASADYRLENHGDIKRTMLGILEELVERLEQLYDSAGASPPRPQVPDVLHNKMQGTRSAGYSITSSIELADSVRKLDKTIEGLLDWLIRFAVAIRQAASHNRDIKSEQYLDPEDEGFKDFQVTTRDLLDCLRAKRLLGKTLTNVAEKTKKELEMNNPRENVYQRIIEGNVRRRKRFLYMRSHDEHLRFKAGPESLMKEETTRGTLPGPHLPPTKVQRLPSETDRPNIALTSSFKSSAHTTATIIDSDELDRPDNPSNQKPAVTMAVSAPAMKVKHHYPAIPKNRTRNGRLKCPYCCLPVELAWGSKLQKKEQEGIWRRHVKSDLRPYVCLLATCTNPTESFISKTDWIRHMELEHQKKPTRWLCRSRHQVKEIFEREPDFVEHMRKSHGGSFTEAMLPALISRSALPPPQIFTCCPLCGYTLEAENMEHASKETSRVLLSHLGEHLEYVALSALPDVLFDSSEISIGSESSVSSSNGSSSRRRDFLKGQNGVQSLQNEDSMPTEDYLVDDTEAEDWAWVYYKLSLDPKFAKPFNCPYPKNKPFVDRPKLFRQLTDMLNYSSNESGISTASAILIHGPRGAGKTQLAVKYAHRVHRHRKDVAVFWFYGNTIADFKGSSLSPMDNRLLSKENADGLDWVTRAQSWLQDERKGAWLVVVDDACLGINPSTDEEESFWQLVDETIPICSHGTLLITSRRRPREGFRNYRTLEVGEMTTEEAHAPGRAMTLPEDAEEVGVTALANIEETTPLALIEAVDRRHSRLPETRREKTSSVGMSGVEAFVVLGVISSIIAIVDGIKKIYDAATNTKGLPEAFRAVAARLPIVESILGSAKQNIEEGKVNEDSCKEVKHVVEACEEKAKRLMDLFHKAIHAKGVSDLKSYYKAVKALGKGSEVENLMKGMLEDVHLLACERGMKTATKAQQEQIIKAITEVSSVSPSVPGHEFLETGFTNTNYGFGTQYNAQGENIDQGSARQYNTAGGSMTFGSTNVRFTTQSFSELLDLDKDEAACLSALFLTDPRDDRAKLINAKGLRVDGTCQWIKSHPLYQSWLRSYSQLLWLSGGPGKGKTTLSIFLAEELEETAIPQDKLFLQYFCDNTDEKRNTAVAVLRGLIYQLLQLRPKLFDHILPTFRREKESQFSLETLWRIFESMVYDPALETTYCVLDGVDECDEASSGLLLQKFAALFSAKTVKSSACHLNLLIVSRDVPDFIPNLLSSFPRISLDPDAGAEIDTDINLFIEAKVEELSRHRQYPRSLRVYVKKVFRERAQGSFLWIGIAAKALRQFEATEVEEALESFSSGLDDLCARMLLRIDSGRRDIAARILRWVVMAVRPLTLSELSFAIEPTVKPSIVPIDRDRRIRDQVSFSGVFLVIKGDKVGLIHQSAKDYFLRKTRDSSPVLDYFRVKEEVANLEIARSCLEYLQSGALENSKSHVLSDGEHLSRFPLLSYAVLHWHEHARFLDRSEDIFDLSLPFYQKNSQIRTSWLKAYWHSESVHLYGYPEPPKSFPLLHLASFLGILPLAEKLVLGQGWINKIKRLSFLNKVDDYEMTALMWAARRGHDAVVRLLLEKGADTEIKENKYQKTALTLAVEHGHEAIIQLLLEKEVDIEARYNTGETALMRAARSGHEAVVQLLLEEIR